MPGAFKLSNNDGMLTTYNWLKKIQGAKFQHVLEKYGKMGVDALASATPVDSGKTAESWNYKITVYKKTIHLSWTNSNVNKGVPIAIILYYGHGTGTGGYVQGRDYINPAIQPIFDEIKESIWEEVKKF